MPNYNLKTRYTVIPSYDVGNIPKLIFFDTTQRYVCICICMYVCMCVCILCVCMYVCMCMCVYFVGTECMYILSWGAYYSLYVFEFMSEILPPLSAATRYWEVLFG